MDLILNLEVLFVVRLCHLELPGPALLSAKVDLVGCCLGSLSSTNMDVEGYFYGITATLKRLDLV